MLNWRVWHGTSAEWNSLVTQFPDYTIYQGYQWGEHRSHFGWMPHRLIAERCGVVVALAQVLVRRFPFSTALAWVPGGPLGAVDAWNKQFRAVLQRTVGVLNLYCRINPMCGKNNKDASQLGANGWELTDSPLNSGISMVYLLSENEEERIAKASKNWRHNLKRSQKYGNTICEWSNPDPDEMLAVYQAMQTLKNLEEQVSRQALVSLLETFGDRCVVVRCCDSQGAILALRGALLLGDKAWDIFAAATPEGRKVYASHAAFWELVRCCVSRGATWYDMSGVDPVGNKGVYDFKKGTGATDQYHLGEWDWANIPLLRSAANFMIKRRSRNI